MLSLTEHCVPRPVSRALQTANPHSHHHRHLGSITSNLQLRISTLRREIHLPGFPRLTRAHVCLRVVGPMDPCLLSCSATLYLISSDRVSHWIWSLLLWSAVVASKSPGILWYPLPLPTLQGYGLYLTLYVDVRYLNSGLHACITSTFNHWIPIPPYISCPGLKMTHIS